ncbi:MAG: ABC transporter substrate-binding protein [Ancrocorticia sp.]|nr:ABC transporter substrate-binding protein [Ancrocorticia sp.]MCI2002963.1 ABC transporter substrate-binding protein [Ancrocorticia sp.]
MRRRNMIAAASILAVVGAAGLSGCGSQQSSSGSSSSGASDATTITLWSGFTETDGKVVQKIADNFNASQDKYKIDVETNPWNVINDKLMSGLSAGNGPDILTYQADSAKGYIEQGAFISMDDFYADASNETDTYRQNVVNDAMVDGKHYGVPMGHAPYSVYFNKEIFKKAGLTEADYPKTWDELVALAQKLTVDTNGDGTPDQYGIALADKDSGYIPTFLQAAGSDLVVDGKAALDTDTAKSVLTYWRDNIYAKQASPTNISLTDAQTLFTSGKAAMFFIGPWIVQTAKDKGIDVGTFEFPKGPSAKVTQAASNYWYVTSQVEGDKAKTEGIYAFMKYFNNKENQITWALEANYPPNRTDITADDLADNPLIAQISPYMDDAKLLLGSVPTGFADVQSELNALGPKISSSTGDISSILEDSNQKIQSIISQ